ncbi:MAG: 30S ribosomal protein S15 [Candidatus Bathyarchaeota archaeon]|nr:MAG: 30S ribosomal protein S15 [Candidatus Bathyarchaeota archaeon]
MLFLPHRGKSHSRRPASKRAPSWCRYSPEEVEAFVIKLAKDKVPPSKIGVILRDQYGIPLVKPITGKSIKEILIEGDIDLGIPEDLNNLIQKANGIARHLSENKADAANKRSLELTVSKIRRLAKYYKKHDSLPQTWTYRPEVVTA